MSALPAPATAAGRLEAELRELRAAIAAIRLALLKADDPLELIEEIFARLPDTPATDTAGVQLLVDVRLELLDREADANAC